MARFIFPLLSTLIAVGLFFSYINGAYDNLKKLREDVATFDQALDRAHELIALRDELMSRFNPIPSEYRRRLEKFLPDHIDNIRLILDIDNIAAARDIVITDFGFAEGSAAAAEAGAQLLMEDLVEEEAPLARAALPYEAVALEFSATAPYENFLAFLHDLERSLRLVDIKSIALSATENDVYTYRVTIETYWLR